MTAKIKLRSQLHLMTGFMAGFIFAFVLLLYVYDVNRASPWCTSSSTLPTATTAPLARFEEAPAARILCMVLTCPENVQSLARHVHATWGKRCSRLVFVSSESYEPLGVVQVVDPSGGGYEDLWNKTREGFRHIWQEYGQDFDWYLKADDDTYVIMENMQYLLSAYDPTTPVYLGYKMTRYNVSYMSGGASYVLSRETLHRFMTQAYESEVVCPQPKRMGIEDFYMGICLQNVGVHLVDSAQALGGDDAKHKFMPLDLESYMSDSNATTPDWLRLMSVSEVETGFNCCSNYSVAFHYASPERMYLYEFLLYHLRVFGRREPSEHHTRHHLTATDLMRRFPLEDNSFIKDLQKMSEKPDNF
ncbi:glycoprotein-N-acetylgalactosamine 3-beta-galactosyltransferase 1 [Drosophila persimilis]|uniref:N-acetylgalactosaminide beta-1,3-galactosyltransferase n=1 Tax=Drosophila pseudoobscura pseudoobscura TaxID=46245 RepID=B5DJV6_DROPS|nr:glycoprotein-N-acetylgalactosamine 3-beta-galactosyltransferase 1 [Drosophila persimilis]XP_002133177.1 glycoprotein-N-acetylgalactosamine 3-beta-galactosyltransferase 1 [Drosophila pseudoobscura]